MKYYRRQIFMSRRALNHVSPPPHRVCGENGRYLLSRLDHRSLASREIFALCSFAAFRRRAIIIASFDGNASIATPLRNVIAARGNINDALFTSVTSRIAVANAHIGEKNAKQFFFVEAIRGNERGSRRQKEDRESKAI